ncbi:MAG: LacI family DNA-binding transcriptional regulator [Chloroflexota bacterium]|nr:MAG: alanine racemase [Bellilinea sp.]
MPRRVTLKEVALRSGVSYQTVSKVINGQVQVAPDTAARIWQAVQELNYRPNYTARSLRAQRSFTIGYSWRPSPPDQANPILDTFLQSMFHAAEQRGYYLLCFPYHSETQRQIESYRELMDTRRVDGFVLSGVEYNDPRVLFLLEQKFPFVAFGRSNPELRFPSIDVDGGYGLRLATEHLLSQGHRKIAALAWPEESRVGNNRMEGYFSAMRAAGIEPLAEWIQRGEGRYAFGYDATRKLLALPEEIRPTAMVCLNDYMAVGAVKAIQDAGFRVGSQIGVTGFDDTPIAQYLTPPLTSVRQPVWEIGERLIALLLNLLEAKDVVQEWETILMQPQLVIRASSRKVDQHDWISEEVMRDI